MLIYPVKSFSVRSYYCNKTSIIDQSRNSKGLNRTTMQSKVLEQTTVLLHDLDFFFSPVVVYVLLLKNMGKKNII
jgi:hypothetical protein